MGGSVSVWEDDTIQFPRLITEIEATQDLDYDALCDSMDLEREELFSLFERAQSSFDATSKFVQFFASEDFRTAHRLCEGTTNTEYVRGQAELLIDTWGFTMDDKAAIMERLVKHGTV
jgi:hypothetical protein